MAVNCVLGRDSSPLRRLAGVLGVDVSGYAVVMRDPEPGKEYEDSLLLELWLADMAAAVAAGRMVPLSRDGEVFAMVVPPEVAEAGLRTLGR